MHLYSSYSASCSSGVKSPAQPETEIDSNDTLSIATRYLLMKGSFILGLVGRNHGLRGFGSTGRRGNIAWSGSAITTRTKLLKPLLQLILLLRRQSPAHPETEADMIAPPSIAAKILAI